MKFKEFVKNKEKFNMAFLGGSITEGAGSSSVDRCFTSIVTAAVAEQFPDTKVSCINAGVGGTTSALGLFRLQRDVLDKEPDILFVEFAVNDSKLVSTGIYMENIIRKARQYRADMPIVLIYTVTRELLGIYDEQELPQSVIAHMKLAEAYHLVQINVGYELYKRSRLNADEFSVKYLTDGVHPNDKGYQGYADIILERLNVAEFDSMVIDRPLLFGRKIENPRLLMCEDMANNVWKLSHCSLYGRLPNYIYSYMPGDELSVSFQGSFLGIYYTIEKDSGSIAYSVDNGEWKFCSMWDKYALSFNRAAFCILEEELPLGEHVVRIRNADRKEEKSEGYYVRIGAFCIG